MESTQIWAELLDGCKVLAALSVDERDPTKQAARVEARKAVRQSMYFHLGSGRTHFSDGAANEIIDVVTRTYIAQQPSLPGDVVTDARLGRP